MEKKGHPMRPVLESNKPEQNATHQTDPPFELVLAKTKAKLQQGTGTWFSFEEVFSR